MAAILSGITQATTLERLSMNDMTSQSTAIIRATVVSGAGEMESGGVILTHYHLKLTEVWKGTKAGVLDVYVPGGAANGLRQLVPGAPTLTPGAEYLLFLWVGPSGRPQIMGLSQGMFTLTQDPSTSTTYAVRPGADERVVNPKTGQPMSDPMVRMKVQDLKTLVLKFVSATQ
jgi:hypothetical protein